MTHPAPGQFWLVLPGTSMRWRLVRTGGELGALMELETPSGQRVRESRKAVLTRLRRGELQMVCTHVRTRDRRSGPPPPTIPAVVLPFARAG